MRARLVYVVLAAICFCQFTAALGQSLKVSDMEKLLFDLKPLPKVHYTWGLWHQFEDCSDRLFYELARITHSLSVAGEWTNAEQIDRCVYICARVNKTKPVIPCSIAVNFSPWHRKFGKELPPTDRGPTYYAEIDFFRERMDAVKLWVKQANDKYQSDVEITCLLLDCERFYVKEGDKAWNDGIREALDVIHKEAGKIFPKARIQWYGRGISYVEHGDGWDKTVGWTGQEITPSLGCSLYCVPELEKTRETYRKTAALADKMGIKDVIPYVALASGYKRGLKKPFYWADDWDYDLIYSYLIGAELNVPWFSQRPKWFAPYDKAKVIVFFPAPFNRGTPAWGKHFVAYVRGATGVKELSDLGFDK